MKWAALAILLLLPLGLASNHDDPDPPVMLDAWLDREVVGPGEELVVSMKWSDASGMDHAYAVPKGPNNLAGHSGQCKAPSTAQVVVIDCPVTIPEYAPAGEWYIGQFTGYDTVGHSANGFEDLTFIVDSPYSDVDAPTFVSLEQHTEYYEVNTTGDWFEVEGAFSLQATDETGIHSGHLAFRGPGENQGLWSQCDVEVNGVWRCDLHGPAELPTGTYTLFGIGINDVVGYHAWYNDDPENWRSEPLAPLFDSLPTVYIDSGIADATPPKLEGFTFPAEVVRGQRFTLQLNVTEATELEHAWFGMRTTRGNALQMRSISGPGIMSDQELQCEGTWGGDVRLTCTMQFPVNFPLGLTQLEWLGLTDSARNEAHYSPQFNGYNHYTYMADDANNDTALMIMPRPLEGALQAVDAVFNEVAPGDVAEIIYKVNDTVEEVIMTLENELGDIVDTTCDATKLVGLDVCELPVPDDADGLYTLTQAQVITNQVSESVDYSKPIPLLAVASTMPESAYSDAASASVKIGAGNQLGADFQAYLAPKVANPTKPPGETPVKAPDHNETVEKPRVETSTIPVWAVNATEEPARLEPERQPIAPPPETEHSTPEFEIPLGPIAPLALLLALVRRR